MAFALEHLCRAGPLRDKHIPGTENCWNDLLSTWRYILHDTSGEGLGSVPLRAIDLFACADAVYYFIVDEHRQSELAEGAGDVEAENKVMTEFGYAKADFDGLFRVSWTGKLL